MIFFPFFPRYNDRFNETWIRFQVVVPKRAALIIDRILKEIEAARENNQLVNDWSPVSYSFAIFERNGLELTFHRNPPFVFRFRGEGTTKTNFTSVVTLTPSPVTRRNDVITSGRAMQRELEIGINRRLFGSKNKMKFFF